MPRTSPCVGAKVAYYPSKLEHQLSPLPFVLHGDGPLSAEIAHVYGDDQVALSVIDSSGVQHARHLVRFQPDTDAAAPTDGDAYATWWTGAATPPDNVVMTPVGAGSEGAAPASS